MSAKVHIYMSAPTRDYLGEIICIIRKIHRLRKELPCAIHGFLRKVWIHRLRSAIHGSLRSTDCAQQCYTYMIMAGLSWLVQRMNGCFLETSREIQWPPNNVITIYGCWVNCQSNVQYVCPVSTAVRVKISLVESNHCSQSYPKSAHLLVLL